MLELVGGGLTAAGCGLLCAAWAGRLSQRSRALHGWIRALAVLETMPFCRREGVGEMLEEAKRAAHCPEVEKTLEEGAGKIAENRLLQLEEAMDSLRFYGLKAQDVSALRPVWRALDEAEGRMLKVMMETCAERLRQLSLEADEEMRRDRKLALSLLPLVCAAALLAML